MDIDHGELNGKPFPLPVDIILDILSILPVKSLMRFKCVSKPWRSLISSANFIAMHTKKATDHKQVMLQRRRVMFNVGKGCRGLYSIDLDQFLHDNADDPYNGCSVTATELDFVRKEFALPKEQDIPPTIFGMYFCNNLLLCKVYHELYLVNPGTRKLKKLPKTPTWRPRPAKRGFDFISGLYGLGFDRSTNDYKVVEGQGYRDGTVVYSVYTLRTDSWRQIESHSRYVSIKHQGIFLNGAIHWLVLNTCTVARSPMILSFRLDEEVFDEIQLPVTHDNMVILGLFRDCLCITFNGGGSQAFVEFWVMKEYKVSESWTRMSVFSPYTTVLSQIGFSTEYDDVMVYDNSFVMYKDFKGGKTLQVRDIPKLGNNAGVYVEGLFPLTD